jgi:hypothetical protein
MTMFVPSGTTDVELGESPNAPSSILQNTNDETASIDDTTAHGNTLRRIYFRGKSWFLTTLHSNRTCERKVIQSMIYPHHSHDI